MDRKVSLDIIKIISCVAVIAQHNVTLDINDPLRIWGENFLIFYLCRFAVPVFVMVSGILLLDPKRPLSYSKIWKKYIPRLIIGLVVIQYIDELLSVILTGNFSWKLLIYPIYNTVTNRTAIPYWYVYMLIGLYMIAPFIRKLVHTCSKCELLYLLTIFFVIRSIVPIAGHISYLTWFSSLISALQIPLFGGYVGYFILGYFLYTYLPNTPKIALYGAVIGLFALITPLLLLVASPTETIPARGNIIADVFSPNIFIFSSCLLVCIRFLDDKIPKSVAKIAKRLSDAGLGIYLWHVVIIHLFAFIFPTPHLNLFLWVFILSLGNYLLGFLCSSLQSLTWKKMKQLLPISQVNRHHGTQ